MSIQKTTPSAVVVYTDGACKGNPGPGGWGAVLRFNGKVLELFDGELMTTNNRMELTAVIMALNTLKTSCVVQLFTDSKYVIEGVTSWMPNWKKRGWKTANNASVKNEDLWRRLDEATLRHDLSWNWVKGHSGVPDNERADELANLGIVRAQTP